MRRNFYDPYRAINPYTPPLNQPIYPQVMPNYRGIQNPFNIPRGNPFSPTAKIAAAATKANKLDLNKIITSTQKGINTINQIIPIYQQVKPIVENTKDFTKVIKRAFVHKKHETKIVEPKEKIEPEIVNPRQEKAADPFPNDEKSPNKPFF